MTKKMILKKNRPKTSYIVFIVIIIVVSIFCSYKVIRKFGDKTEHILSSYAETAARKLVTTVINQSITHQVLSDEEIDKLFVIEKNNNDDIRMIDFNSKIVTKFLNMITNLIEINLNKVEKGDIDDFFELTTLNKDYSYDNLKKGIIYEIPLGAWTNNAFLSSIGPKVPVKLSIIGDVISSVTTNIKEYGINNAMLEVGIKVEVSTMVNLPFFSKRIVIAENVPIALKVIQGSIPNFYLDGLSRESFLYSNA